jgi:putative sterol carrier protein
MSIEEKRKIADEIIKELEKRLNENKDLAEGWGKAIQLVFTDIETGYRMKFAMDGTIEKIEKKPASEIKLEDAEATSYCAVYDLKEIFDGKVSAMEAMGSGKFRIEGKMDALLKLAPAIM